LSRTPKMKVTKTGRGKLMSEKDVFENLVDAVAEQTGKPRGVCRNLITELGSEIAKAAAEGEHVEIDGLGTFSFEQEKPGTVSSLAFQPSEELQDLVNAPYAHMHPEIVEDEQIADTPGQEDAGESGEGEIASKENTGEEPAPTAEPASGSSLSFKNRYRREEKSQGSFWIIAAAFIILLLAVGAWYMIGLMSGNSETPEQTPVENTQSAEETSQSQPAASEASQETPENNQEEAQEEEQQTAADQQANGDEQDGDSATQQDRDQPEQSNRIITVTVERGQTLWGLADNQYENPYLWPWIYDTNREDIDDPDIIYVGQALDIPLRSGADNRLSQSDSLQVALAYVETYLWYKEQKLENAHFYLYAAKSYHNRVFEHTDAELDPADLRFANRAQ